MSAATHLVKLLFEMEHALQEAVKWNAEYKRLNNLAGDPYWVPMAEDALRHARGER